VTVLVVEVREASTVGGPALDCWLGSTGEGGDDWEVPITSTSIIVDLSLGVADADELDQARAQGARRCLLLVECGLEDVGLA